MVTRGISMAMENTSLYIAVFVRCSLYGINMNRKNPEAKSQKAGEEHLFVYGVLQLATLLDIN